MNTWLPRVALQKVAKRLVQLGVAWVAAQNLDRIGVTVDETVLTGAVYAGLEFARGFLKQKFGWKFL